MTDKKAERILNAEADAILQENREKLLDRLGLYKTQKNTGKTVGKVLSVAAAVIVIAAFAYICYLPVYMQDHGLFPASGETGSASSAETEFASSELTDDKTNRNSGKLTATLVTDIIASSKTYDEVCDKIDEAGEIIGKSGSGILYTFYKLYFGEEAIGTLTVSKLEVSYTVGPNSYVLCRTSDYWQDNTGNDEIAVTDYGEYNGYKVKLIPGMACVISGIDVGVYSFRFGSSFVIKAEKNGIEYDLGEVYEKGDLSEDDIAEINMIHRSRFGLYYDSAEEMEKAVRYNTMLTGFITPDFEPAEINRAAKEIFKSIYGN